MNLNKPKVINNINNILINLNENNSDLKTKKKYLDNKKNAFLKKINTELDFKTHNFKNMNNNNNKDKISKMDNNTNKNDKKINTNNKYRYSNSNYAPKVQKDLFKNKIIKTNNLIKSSLAHQYSICFSKNNIAEKMNSTQHKQSLIKSKFNDSKIIIAVIYRNTRQNKINIFYSNFKYN